METSERLVLIERFRSARSAGVGALQDLSNKHKWRQFLARAKTALQALYGSKAPVVRKYVEAIKRLRDLTGVEFADLYAEFEHILDKLELISGEKNANARSQASVPPAGHNVFIIHGHDEVNKLRLYQLLQGHFGLSPVLMMSRPGMSRSLVDKFEDSASTCALAFAIITPDDKIIKDGKSYCQARPNVIFEAGWFVGRLGIPRVCLLLKDGTTVQSDIDGISRIHFRESIEEKVLDIQRELEAVGLLNA